MGQVLGGVYAKEWTRSVMRIRLIKLYLKFFRTKRRCVSKTEIPRCRYLLLKMSCLLRQGRRFREIAEQVGEMADGTSTSCAIELVD